MLELGFKVRFWGLVGNYVFGSGSLKSEQDFLVFLERGFKLEQGFLIFLKLG